jgi:hypothetical protein
LAELRSLMEGSNDPDKMEVELNEEGMAEWFGFYLIIDTGWFFVFLIYFEK